MTKVIDFNQEKKKADFAKQISEIQELVAKSRAKIEENPWPYISKLEAQGLLMLTILADIEQVVFAVSEDTEAQRLAQVAMILSRIEYF